MGYRVNSKKGTEFRIWATNILKQHFIQGYTLNEKKLKEQARKFQELQQTVKLLQNVVTNKELSSDEAEGLLKIITEYSYALDILDKYDHQKLKIESTSSGEIFKINYKEAIKAIKSVKEKMGGSELFGREKDESFKSSLNTIYQTFDWEDLYPSIEEKAAIFSILL